ncbi:histidine phosphatase family protein [Mycobacterium sp. MS1601]|uniref:histidine phosphatase family protein n=1 Tax=Mycobacterium sp. MS1601 TaxID=1936029 RepID=UPI000979472C|nr:histidine phosphatase family protein [Mycobacterium sp. MS1601]AQA01603.1 histidine phosphatase family protein [Mycobacterium sp. MS1601]
MPRLVAPALVLMVVLSACGSEPAPPESITLTFVRHAQSQANASGLIDTSVPGPGITADGERQAQQVAEELRSKDFDGIYASSMVRTQQTAAPLAEDLGEQVDVLPGLQEIPAGWFEGTSEADAAATYFLAPSQWLQGQRNARIPGAIDGNEFNDDFTAAVQRIYDSGDKNAVAFSHGAAIMMWTQMNVTNSDGQLLMSHPLPNVGQVVIEGNPVTGWQLVSWDGLSTM